MCSAPFIAMPDVPISGAHLHEYLDVWAYEPSRGAALSEVFRTRDWTAHVSAWNERQAARAAARADVPGKGGKPYTMTRGGIAVVELAGTLMKQESSDEESTSTIRARRQVRLAANDPDVKGIFLSIDSPGGTVSGTVDLADDVAAAAKVKPVTAYCADLCCSAAYWIGCQAMSMSANRTAAVGSIGVYTVVHDLSKMAEQEGVGVFVISSGKYKGLGVPGTKISEALLGELQKRVDGLAGHFIEAVAKGRNLSREQAVELADGRVHSADDAVKLKLIDRVESADEALAALERRIGSHSPGRKIMSDTATAPVVATLEQLEAACPGASSDFIVGQLKAKATVETAQKACIQSLNAKLAESATALKAAEDRATAAEAKVKPAGGDPKANGGIGHDPLKEKAKGAGDGDADAGDPIEKFEALVQEKVAAGMPKHKATAAVIKGNKDLHAAYVEAHNAKLGK